MSDATLPETGWGEFLVHDARPEVGSQWTDSGKPPAGKRVYECRHTCLTAWLNRRKQIEGIRYVPETVWPDAIKGGAGPRADGLRIALWRISAGAFGYV
ncbi:hypothetical protein ABZ800_29380 [Streptomyces sp. NPDC047813]|uniref:hypothetical protein n=1 Tax=Streptomyces sp. NPDC047813 TaxID=3154608 RepID=UPI0033CB843F